MQSYFIRSYHVDDDNDNYNNNDDGDDDRNGNDNDDDDDDDDDASNEALVYWNPKILRYQPDARSQKKSAITYIKVQWDLDLRDF